MNDAVDMGIAKRRQKLVEYWDRLGGSEVLFVAQNAIEVGPVDVLHDDEIESINLIVIIDPHDVLVFKSGQGQRFTLEVGGEHFIGGNLRVENLKRDLLLEFGVVSEIDSAESAFT